MGEELQPGDPERLGPYRVTRRLGSGGMGRVYLCRSAGGRPVAVKVIRADLAADREFRARFRREVEAARRVSGLYTALVVDADLDGPTPWLATAYVPGPSLADAVGEHGPLPADSVLTLAAGLAESLAAIHAAGVVHRDLKPTNVLLADDGPRVIDFGISRAVEASVLTHTGLVVGSPGFMSPEQAEGGRVGPPSDVFSLGAVLTFAATGQGPFGAGSTAALIYRVVHGTPVLDGLSAEIRPLVERCLAKEPGQRPTAQDLLAELGDPGVAEDGLPSPMIKEEPSRTNSYTPTHIGAEPTVTRARPAAPGPTGPRPSEPRSSEPRSSGPRSSGPRSSDRRRASRPEPALVATLADPECRAVYAVTFAPWGTVLAAANANGQVYLWHVASGRVMATFADPGSRGVIGVAIDPDGELLAAADGNGRAYMWDVPTGELMHTVGRRGSRGMNGVAFGLNGDVLATAGGNGQVQLWDVISGKSTGTLTIPGSMGVYDVAFGLGGGVLAAADGNGRTYLWDVAHSAPIGAFGGPGSRGVNGVAFGPGGNLVAAADGNGCIYLWDVARGGPAGTFGDPGSRGVNGVAFGPRGDVVAAADGNGGAYLWDVGRGELVGTLAGPGSRGVNGVAFGPGGDLLAAADGNGSVFLWKTGLTA